MCVLEEEFNDATKYSIYYYFVSFLTAEQSIALDKFNYKTTNTSIAFQSLRHQKIFPPSLQAFFIIFQYLIEYFTFQCFLKLQSIEQHSDRHLEWQIVCKWRTFWHRDLYESTSNVIRFSFALESIRVIARSISIGLIIGQLLTNRCYYWTEGQWIRRRINDLNEHEFIYYKRVVKDKLSNYSVSTCHQYKNEGKF